MTEITKNSDLVELGVDEFAPSKKSKKKAPKKEKKEKE